MSQRENRKGREDTNKAAAPTPRRPAWGTSVPNPSEPSAIPKSVWGIASSTTERSHSAFPSLNDSMRNMSVDTTTTTTRAKDSRSQSVRQGNRRRILCSAVPDSAVLTPIRRPDEGGSKGQAISIYTNHFPVTISDAIINQYDIDIAIIDRNGKPRLARKDDRWKVIQTISKQKKDFPAVWYDEGKTLYSRALLPDINQPIQVKLERDGEVKIYQLTILNLVRQDKIGNIFDFIQKKTSTRPHDTVRIIETLFKQRARNEFVAVKNQFYDRRQKLEDLQDGRGMGKGFYQALFLTRSGPTLNINLTFTCFYMPLNFVDFTCKYLRKNIISHPLTEHELRAFKRIVRDLFIETNHAGHIIRYKLRGFGLPANQLTFPRDGSDENTTERISVADYFSEKYNKKLKYPYLPCIDGTNGISKRANWLPMELVTLVEWQRSLKPLDTTQRSLVSSKSIINPQSRYDQIMNIVHNREFDKDSYLKELNIDVNTKEMLEIKARILSPPQVKYRARQGRGDAIEQVDCGKWKIRNWFYTTPEIQRWGIIYLGDTYDDRVKYILQSFKDQFPNLLRRNGFVIRSELAQIIKTSRKDDIRNGMAEASGNRWQLAIVILNDVPSDVYDYVKQLGHQRLGLVTQCVDLIALENNLQKLHMYVENISQKINGKLGGINSVVNTKLALSRSTKEDLFMFFGADVTHSTCSTEVPSIAAVVGSRDPTNSLYAARLCEQYPKKGRCSLEIIKELDKMVADLLRVFADTCGGRLPNKIVFYRDGVDTGHYQKVLDNEVTKIKAACRVVYGNKPLPLLIFIVVKKRHNTRFFSYDGKQTMNVQAGTVIDQDITHPSQFDFYLCSQTAIKGTLRPTLYHVLHDDIGFSSDDIQQLTYWLCHTDMRCTKSVSIPAPVHYAHLSAYASRTLKFGNDDHNNDATDNDETESNVDDSESSQNYSLDDIKTQLMILDPKVANDMWFI
ncbi:unnamed protein product [Adineta steineri]|uniref:Uncharacterized protein n=1 Tax=Adineta steineri TaxID=433720 RepID=A0A818RVD1_9BILA|nr:unnamed protein product [Adineta steineri]